MKQLDSAYTDIVDAWRAKLLVGRDELASAFEAWDLDEELDPMRDFLKVETVKTWRGLL